MSKFQYLLIAAVAISPCAADASSFTIREEYSQLVEKSSQMPGLGNDVFGESIDMATGRTEFTSTIIDLPGNNHLPVRLARRFVIDPFNPTAYWFGQHHMGQWQLDIPYIHGVYARTRPDFPGSPFKCGQSVTWGLSTPPAYERIRADEYWYGNHVYVPGAGDGEILWASSTKTPKPTGYPYIASNGLRLRCADAIANAPGQGFIAIDEQGTTYHFGWKVELMASTAYRPANYYEAAETGRSNFALQRNEVRLYATKVVDRFGNVVNYNWVGDELRSISSSDGRHIELSYLGGKIASAAADGRTWTFLYEGGEQYPQFSHLRRLVNPDGSAWSFQKGGYLDAHATYDQRYEEWTCAQYGTMLVCGGRYYMDKMGHCSWMRRLNDVSMTVAMTAPSGVSGEFVFAPKRQARTGVPDDCMESSEPYDGYSAYRTVPIYYDTFSIISKKLSGPGLTPQTWSYSYSAPTGKVAPHDESNAVKQTVVNGPGGVTTHVFGKVYARDDNKLLSLIEPIGDGSSRVSSYSYVTAAEATSLPFDHVIGGSDQMLSSYLPQTREPVRRADVTLNGTLHRREVLAFDQFARPQKTSVSATPATSPPPPPPRDPIEPPPRECGTARCQTQ